MASKTPQEGRKGMAQVATQLASADASALVMPWMRDTPAAYISDSGILARGSYTWCNTKVFGRSRHADHREKIPLIRVYMDLLRPVLPAAKRGTKYVSKSTHSFRRFGATYLIKNKEHTQEPWIRYSICSKIWQCPRTTSSLPTLGWWRWVLRQILRITPLAGGHQAGVHRHQHSTAKPHFWTRWSDPYRRYMLPSTIIGLPRYFFWRGFCCTVVDIINRLPHAMLNNDHPNNTIISEPAALFYLRVVGARAFVHRERYNAKLGKRE